MMRPFCFRDARNKPILYPLLALFIGTIGATSVNRPNNRVSYAAFIFLLAAFIFETVRDGKHATLAAVDLRPYDLVPLVLLMVWLYGFILGLAYHNQTGNVIRNFAGMTLYSVYYLLLFRRVNKFDLLRCVLMAAAINTIYMFIFFLWDKLFYPLVSVADRSRLFTGLSVRDYYSDTLVLLAVPIMLITHHLLSPRPPGAQDRVPEGPASVREFGAVALLYAYLFAFLQISLSKATLVGYCLAILFVLIYFHSNLLELFERRQIMRVSAIVGTLLISASPAVQMLDYYAPWFARNALGNGMSSASERPASPHAGSPTATSAAFARNAPGNGMSSASERPASPHAGSPTATSAAFDAETVRRDQNRELIKDLHLFGKGLGAALSSGYSRDANGYGFEQSYLNVAHKFGIFAALVFLAYLFVGYRILHRLTGYKSRQFGIASTAFFAGLVMAYGNPILMSPVMVTLQCVILYWLRDDGQRMSFTHGLASRGADNDDAS